MSTRTPALQQRSQYGAYWGVFATALLLPNAASAPLAAAQFVLEAGDVAFVTGGTLYVCTSPGTVGGADATWLALGAGGGGPLEFIPRSMSPQGNSSVSYSNVNLTSISAFNNAAARVTNTGSAEWLERQIRNGLQTPVTVQSTAGQNTGRQFGLGAPSRFQCVFGLLGTAPDSRLLVGLIDSASAQLTGGAVPSAAARPAGIWLGMDAGDANLQLMHKQTGVVATKIDLGAAFARAANLSVLFDLSIFPGGATYSVTRLDAAGSAAGVIAGPDIPIDGAALAWQWSVGTNATGTQFGAIDCVALEIESQIP